MIIDLHVIQNIAPANLNRDDTGSPKDAIFGGYRRARVSSQAWKRAMRNAFRDDHLIDAELNGVRTKRIVERMVKELATDQNGRDSAIAQGVAVSILASMGLATDDALAHRPTQYLLYLGEDEIAKLIHTADTHWDVLAEAVRVAGQGGPRKAKKDAKAEVPEAVRKATANILSGSKAADLALFGRMLADLPTGNIDGAAQVAHAISTNAIEMEFDFYTAVDDLQDKLQDTGAGMMGTVEYNSATFYRYANLDLAQLAMNLGDDAELVTKTSEAFIRAFVMAMPTGKQTSFAAQNPPSLILAVVRPSGRWALTNAFVKPVDGRYAGNTDQIGRSIEAMGRQWSALTTMYGGTGLFPILCVDPDYTNQARAFGENVGSLDALAAAVLAATNGGVA